MSQVVAYLRERLPADAIIANGAGNYTAWIHRFYQYRSFRTQVAPSDKNLYEAAWYLCLKCKAFNRSDFCPLSLRTYRASSTATDQIQVGVPYVTSSSRNGVQVIGLGNLAQFVFRPCNSLCALLDTWKSSKICEKLGLIVAQIVYRFSALNFLRRLIEGPAIMKTP
jgi:hypothetical protein